MSVFTIIICVIIVLTLSAGLLCIGVLAMIDMIIDDRDLPPKVVRGLKDKKKRVWTVLGGSVVFCMAVSVVTYALAYLIS